MNVNDEKCDRSVVVKKVSFAYEYDGYIKCNNYITKGYGITIHQAICPNINDADERLIEVNWNPNIEKKYPTNILVHAESNKTVLLDIISKTSNTDITVLSINTLSSSDEFLFDVTVSVPSLDKLKKFMDDIRLLDEITEVERIIK